MKIIREFDSNQIHLIEDQLILNSHKENCTNWTRTYFLRNSQDGKIAIVSLTLFDRFQQLLQKFLCCQSDSKFRQVFGEKNFNILSAKEVKRIKTQFNKERNIPVKIVPNIENKHPEHRVKEPKVPANHLEQEEPNAPASVLLEQFDQMQNTIRETLKETQKQITSNKMESEKTSIKKSIKRYYSKSIKQLTSSRNEITKFFNDWKKTDEDLQIPQETKKESSKKFLGNIYIQTLLLSYPFESVTWSLSSDRLYAFKMEERERVIQEILQENEMSNLRQNLDLDRKDFVLKVRDILANFANHEEGSDSFKDTQVLLAKIEATKLE